MRAFSLAWIQAPGLALLQQVAFLSECFLKQELEYKGELHSQTGLMQTRQGLSPWPPVSTATYRVICSELPRAVLTSSPRLLYSLLFPPPWPWTAIQFRFLEWTALRIKMGVGMVSLRRASVGLYCWQHLHQIIEHLPSIYFWPSVLTLMLCVCVCYGEPPWLSFGNKLHIIF